MKKVYIFSSLILCALPLFFSCNPDAISEESSLYEYQQAKDDTGDDDEEINPEPEETPATDDTSGTEAP